MVGVLRWYSSVAFILSTGSPLTCNVNAVLLHKCSDSTSDLQDLFSFLLIDVGYCQGMNDLLARFLAVTDSEVDSYWMFCHYMDEKRPAFLEESMMVKVGE